MERVQRISPVPIPAGRAVRRRGAGDTWKSAAASVLLHVCLGTAAVWGVSGTPEDRIPVIDLTLAESGAGPAEASRGTKGIPVSRAAASGRASRSGISPAVENPALAETAPSGPDASETSPAAAPPPSRVPSVADRSDPETSAGQADAASGAVRGAGSGSLPYAAATPSPLATRGGGTGAGIAAGDGGGRNAAAASGRSAAEGIPQGFTDIRDAVQRYIVYPAAAHRMGWEGTVVVRFRVVPDGSVREVRIVKGSGYPVLDRGAMDAVRKASPFRRVPREAEVVIPVIYQLKPAP